jgi:hypothetical protein
VDPPREGAWVVGTIAIIVLVIGALAIGAAAQYLGRALGYEWAITALAAAIGGLRRQRVPRGHERVGPAVRRHGRGAGADRRRALVAAIAELAVHSTGQPAS